MGEDGQDGVRVVGMDVTVEGVRAVEPVLGVTDTEGVGLQGAVEGILNLTGKGDGRTWRVTAPRGSSLRTTDLGRKARVVGCRSPQSQVRSVRATGSPEGLGRGRPDNRPPYPLRDFSMGVSHQGGDPQLMGCGDPGRPPDPPVPRMPPWSTDLRCHKTRGWTDW